MSNRWITFREWLAAEGLARSGDVSRLAAVLTAIGRRLHELHLEGLCGAAIAPDRIRIRSDSGDLEPAQVRIDCNPFSLDDGNPASTETRTLSSGTGSGLCRSQVYLAPEVLCGGVVDRRADLYPFAILTYQVLFGELDSPIPEDWRVEVWDGPLRDLLERYLAVAPDFRPESALPLVEALRRLTKTSIGPGTRASSGSSRSRGAGWRAGAICLLCLLAAWFAVSVSPLEDRLTYTSYAWPCRSRPKTNPTNAVILYMDAKSHQELEQPWDGRWDRSVHARLIQRLSGLGARAVVFDVLFEEESLDPAEDEALIEAARESQRVVVGGSLRPIRIEDRVIGTDVAPPFIALREVAGWGLSETVRFEGYAWRHANPFNGVPTLAQQTAAIAGDHVPDGYEQEQRWLNYYGPPGTIAHHSYTDALAGRIPSHAVLGRVVFVGALADIGFTGGRRTDDYETPFTPKTGMRSPGVEINATAYLNLVRGDWIRRLGAAWELVFAVSLALLLASACSYFRPFWLVAFLILISLAVNLFVEFVFTRFGIWFAWLPVLIAQLPAAWVCSVVIHTGRRRRPHSPLSAEVDDAGKPAGSEHATTGNAVIARPVLPGLFVYPKSIGAGAYGEVWLARDDADRLLAVKVVRLSRFSRPQAFQREFDGVSHFSALPAHPALISVLRAEIAPSGEFYFYTMTAADDLELGRSIRPGTYRPKTLRAVLREQAPLGLRECLTLALRLLDAIDHLHRHRLVHRDIKPSNILYLHNEPCLADIGLICISRVSDGIGVRRMGTPAYMPPEGNGTPSSDLYALGMVLSECFSLTDTPSNSAGREVARADPRKAFQSVIAKSIDTHEPRRYQSALKMLGDLQAIATRVG